MTRHERKSSRMGTNSLVFLEGHRHRLGAEGVHALAEERHVLFSFDDVADRADETLVRPPRLLLGCRRASLGWAHTGEVPRLEIGKRVSREAARGEAARRCRGWFASHRRGSVELGEDRERQAEYDPQEAIGLDGALSKLAAESYGTLLLGTAAAGLLAYGAFCFVQARYRQI